MKSSEFQIVMIEHKTRFAVERQFNDGRDDIFKKPEFLPPAEVPDIKSVTDSTGKPWCIFSQDQNWAITPASVKVHSQEPVLEVSIRLKWADDKEFVAPDGEIPIVGVWKVAELAAFNHRHPKLTFFAFPLSFMPKSIHVT